MGKVPLARRLFHKAPPWFKVWCANRRFRRRLNNLGAVVVKADAMKQRSAIAFAIVHWNAPDYLALNMKRLAQLYPASRVYVLDNGSAPNAWVEAHRKAIEYGNVRLYKARGESELAVGLQFLLEKSAHEGDRYLCFLDQDCLLVNPIEPLLRHFGNGVGLIGPEYFHFPGMVHSSLAILQPQITWALFGKEAFSFHTFSFHKMHAEPMFGISKRFAGRVLTLKHDFGRPREGMSTYSLDGVDYAWHGWYSSRTYGLDGGELLDGKPVSYWREARDRNFRFMEAQFG